MKHVLFLSSAEEEQTRRINDDLVASLNATAKDISFSWANYHDICFSIIDGEVAVEQISTGRKLDTFDLIYFKSYFRYHEQAVSIAEFLRKKRVRYIGAELDKYIPAYKLSQMVRLAISGVRVPDTIYLSTRHYSDHYDMIVSKIGTPFILKDANGSTGDNNHLIRSKGQLDEVVVNDAGLHFLAQKFIRNSGDLRVIVLSGQIDLVIERKRLDDSTHLNNTSQGASAKLIRIESLSSSVSDIALKAAEVTGRDVAGVDVMIEDETGIPYILEVNASPQVGSGAYTDEKIAMLVRYCRRTMEA